MTDKKPLLSLTKKDFRIDTFTSGGPGGQHQNKVATGVHITHMATGLSAESRTEKSQARNKKIAFTRLCKSAEFQKWLRIEVLYKAKIEKAVEAQMDEKNIKTEIKKNGKWVSICGKEKPIEEFHKDKAKKENSGLGVI
jgi:protein subunit release factor B